MTATALPASAARQLPGVRQMLLVLLLACVALLPTSQPPRRGAFLLCFFPMYWLLLYRGRAPAPLSVPAGISLIGYTFFLPGST